MKNIDGFQRSLLSWFRKHKRLLPWREKADPYRIFVVEVMLQQTQIRTVLPYYERWMKTFPTVRHLARARSDRVLKLWEGLGYYTRARNLHKAAQIIACSYAGKIPRDAETLQKLPGIGRYTAGAIASIAFGQPASLVDGNVARVLSRLFNLRDDISNPPTHQKFYRLAETLLPRKDPGSFNQALMELGSLVCIPEAPRCLMCPVSRFCKAYRQGDPASLPIRSKAIRIKKIDMVVGIAQKEGAILVRRRPERGIWGGLWELPGTVRAGSESLEGALENEFEKSLGMPARIGQKLKPIEHRFTHRKAKIYPFVLSVGAGGQNKRHDTHIRWADSRMLHRLSFPVPHQKIIETVRLDGKS